jgi:hypothetical protein
LRVDLGLRQNPVKDRMADSHPSARASGSNRQCRFVAFITVTVASRYSPLVRKSRCVLIAPGLLCLVVITQTQTQTKAVIEQFMGPDPSHD